MLPFRTAMKKRHLRTILKKYLQGNASPEETATIEKWYAKAGENPVQQPNDLVNIKDQLYRKIQSELNSIPESIPFYKSGVFRMLAAACILLLAGIFTWYLLSPGKQAKSQIAATKEKIPEVVDIPSPASVYAVLTLADGRKIRLDTAANGSLAIQISAEVIKNEDGHISYKAGSSANIHPEYNILTVPRGSRIISLKLSDGSLVVLNAESSIRYPTVFAGNRREVSVSGEAYFSITKNAAMPFFVNHNGVSIKVLGTQFNVNSYDDEDYISVTLLEGAVHVSQGALSQSLKPGQQARMNSRDGITIDNHVDLEEVMAWKNGRFQFGEKADITSIMRQISRWYNIDIEYRGAINQQFWGSMWRSANVSQVLEMLEETGRVKFKMEEKKIIVMPVNN